jgi:hypothetical protein
MQISIGKASGAFHLMKLIFRKAKQESPALLDNRYLKL